jgi:hypothetical protein
MGPSLAGARNRSDGTQKRVLRYEKPGPQKNDRHIAAQHLLPRFGDKAVSDVTRQEVRPYCSAVPGARGQSRRQRIVHDWMADRLA